MGSEMTLRSFESTSMRDLKSLRLSSGTSNDPAGPGRVDAVVHQIERLGVGAGGEVVLRRFDRRMHVRDPDPPAHPLRAKRLHREAVPEQLVVCRQQRVEHERRARRVHPQRVPVQGDRSGLVDRHPLVDPVAEGGAGEGCVVGETVRRVTGHPAARVLERFGQVPMEKGRHGSDAGREQFVQQSIVEGDPGAVRAPAAGGLDTRPRDREPVGVEPQLLPDRTSSG